MSQLIKFSLLIVVGTLISAFSQVLLKKSSQKEYPSRLREYLNPLVITAYIVFFGCTLITMYALKVVPLFMSPILEASGYIFTAVLSYVFFREKLTMRQFIGMILVLAGIAICSVGAV